MTPDQRRDAWLVALMETGSPIRADWCLDILEQREREGRFGDEKVPPPAGYSLAGWANPNAVKRYEDWLVRLEEYRALHFEEQRMREEAEAAFEGAHAEAERLKAKLAEEASAWRDEKRRADDEKASADRLHAELGAARSGRAKAQRLLKEALGLLSRWRKWSATSKDPMGALDADTERSLARARLEGFSDGE